MAGNTPCLSDPCFLTNMNQVSASIIKNGNHHTANVGWLNRQGDIVTFLGAFLVSNDHTVLLDFRGGVHQIAADFFKSPAPGVWRTNRQ